MEQPRTLVTGGSGFIGSHLIELLTASGHQVCNVDIRPPQLKNHSSHWRECSIMEPDGLLQVLADFKPAFIVHLAAYAAMGAKSLDEFQVNTKGTTNVLDAVSCCPDVSRLIVTSSQHVRKPGNGDPVDDEDYVPFEFYGESKAIMERLVRRAGLQCAWTIIRPTNVWGPLQPPLAEGVWRLIRRRQYFHPMHDAVVRSYGYVRNVAWQILRILEAPKEDIDRRTLYVGDKNMLQRDWIEAFSISLTGKPTRKLPLVVIRLLSLVGDFMQTVGLSFPVYASRFHNMTTPNPVLIDLTFRLLGTPPISFEQGVRETTSWLECYYASRERA